MNKNVLKNVLYIIIAGLIGVIIALSIGLNKKNEDISIAEQNLLAANDTIKYYQLNNGDLLAEKYAYVLNEKNLRDQLNLTKQEVNDLKKKLNSDLTNISKIDSEIIFDTLYIPSDTVKIINNTLNYKFSYNDKWLTLNGETFIDSLKSYTNIYNINIPVDLIVGTTKNKKIFVESKNPYLQINSIEGAILDNTTKKSHWGIGFGVGVGLQYGLIHKNIDFGPQINFGLQYNF